MTELESRDNEVYRSIFESSQIPDSARLKDMEALKEVRMIQNLSSSALLSNMIAQLNNLSVRSAFQDKSYVEVGTMVKTLKNAYVPVNTIGSGNMLNYDNDSRIGKRMYKCSTEKYPELFEDLYISGYHSILVDKLTDEQKNKCIKVQKQVLFTEDMCRLPACADERTEPCRQSGLMKIWNIALNNKDKKGNYGIYANGLLVESCSIDRLKNKSGLRIK